MAHCIYLILLQQGRGLLVKVMQAVAAHFLHLITEQGEVEVREELAALDLVLQAVLVAQLLIQAYQALVSLMLGEVVEQSITV